MNGAEGERIHPPTPRRRQQARQQGHVARSRDLVAAGVLVSALAIAWMQGSDLTRWIGGLAIEQLGDDVRISADSASAVELGRQMLFQMASAMFPVFGLLLLAAIISQVGQFGVLFVPEKLAPDAQRLNPVANGQRLVGADNWVRSGLGLLKLAAVLAVAGWSLWDLRLEILSLGAGDASAIATGAVSVFGVVAFRVLVAIVGLAIADFAFQRWHYERQLWMTEDQRREESRDEQSGTRTEQQRRQRRQQLVQPASDSQVAQADVVLIAGNSMAVALRYDPATMPAPQLLAKGTGQTAVEIFRSAQRHGKWIVDDRKLTRALCRRVAAGQELPAEMYSDIARLFAELPRYKMGV
jgi:flagellar biosynthesis protein FlhB